MSTPEKFSNSKEVIAFLAQTFPSCFSVEGEAKPLKIGIFQDLAERLEDEPRVSKTLLRSTLRHYTNSWRYLYSIKEGVQRVDLDGEQGEVIEKQHADHAEQQLAESKAKAAEKRKAQQKERKPKPDAARKKGDWAKKVKGTKPRQPRSQSSESPAKLDETTLKVGVDVTVKLGKVPMKAVITEVGKDGVQVQLESGMVVKVTPDSLRLASTKRS